MAFAARRPDDPETKARVLRAATDLFAERGFHGAKVRDIAERAGANVAASHYHFGSKRDLYVEVLRACFASVRALLAEGGAQPDPAALDRMTPAALEALVEKRIAVMLAHLLGPPPSAHGTLMLREMLDPSDALPIVVGEFVEPMIAETGDIVRRLAPGLDDEHVRWCVASTMGQAFFYRATLPAALRVFKLPGFSRVYGRRLAAHIAAFSAGGIERVAGSTRKARAR
jgi:TetR/AcrR family transcriptional regulator, regulator of cefoperazone and chloramphenicol sensitivity